MFSWWCDAKLTWDFTDLPCPVHRLSWMHGQGGREKEPGKHCKAWANFSRTLTEFVSRIYFLRNMIDTCIQGRGSRYQTCFAISNARGETTNTLHQLWTPLFLLTNSGDCTLKFTIYSHDFISLQNLPLFNRKMMMFAFQARQLLWKYTLKQETRYGSTIWQ